MGKAELLSVIHEHTAQITGNTDHLDEFLQQSIGEIKKGEERLQRQFVNLGEAEPPLDEITLHDLRSPLNLIIGFSEVLLDEVESPLDDVQRVALKTILNAGLELSVFIDEHLDTTRYIR